MKKKHQLYITCPSSLLCQHLDIMARPKFHLKKMIFFVERSFREKFRKSLCCYAKFPFIDGLYKYNHRVQLLCSKHLRLNDGFLQDEKHIEMILDGVEKWIKWFYWLSNLQSNSRNAFKKWFNFQNFISTFKKIQIYYLKLPFQKKDYCPKCFSVRWP